MNSQRPQTRRSRLSPSGMRFSKCSGGSQGSRGRSGGGVVGALMPPKARPDFGWRRIVRCSEAEAIEPRCRSVKEVGFLSRAHPLRQAFAGIPIDAVAVRALVHGEIAFEHRAPGTEGCDAGLDVRLPQRGELFGARRQIAFVDIEAEHLHAEAAQLHVHVGTGCELADSRAPLGEDLVVLALVAT